MKFVAKRSDLLAGVNTVIKAVPNKSSMSILECILVDTTGGFISLTGNDMDLGIETIIDGDIIEKGVIALDSKIFSEIIRKLPENDITVEVDNNNFTTTITCENARFNIVGKSGDDYSYLPVIEKDNTIVLSQLALKDVIRQTIFSIADGVDDTPGQQTMKGELFEVFGDFMRVTALDGHRIATRRIQLRDVFDPKKVIIPGKSLNELSKILTGGADDDVEISFSKNQVMFEFESTKVVTRLIEGAFFDIERMNSTDYETKMKVNKRQFLDCIDRATLLVKEGDKKPIILNIIDTSVTMTLNSVVGSMKEEISIDKSGKDIMIAFNPKFMMDALRVIEDDEIELYMVNSKAPCFLKNSSESYIYVVLPVNFSTVQ